MSELPDSAILKAHVTAVILRRVDTDESRRREALSDYMAVTRVADEAAAARMAEMVPPLMTGLYARWAGMFADRLLETLPADTLGALCDGSAENDAALSLAFLMFLESERMEQQVQQDLEAYGRAHSDDGGPGAAAAACIRARLASLADAAEAAAQAARPPKDREN
ncbi:MAG: hypothetical protein AB7D57_11770 [Desulfovibrionaceae bacterium]